MTRVKSRAMTVCVVFILQRIGFGQVIPSSKRMADGKEWTTQNLNIKNVKTDPSYCYADAERNCGQYGRLYTWESAQRACRSLGEGWRLPTNEDWRQLANRYDASSKILLRRS